jgi:alpha-beta hydrolase superfamily lysophospholipase
MSDADLAAARALIESDLMDLDLQLERERKNYQRHLLWLVVGVSPGALLPMLFVLTELGGAALVALLLTVGVLEGWRAYGSKRAIRRLETMEMELREQLAEVVTPPSIPPPS